MRRHPPNALHALLTRLYAVDRMVKGDAPGDPWDALERLVLVLAGVQFAGNSDNDYA